MIHFVFFSYVSSGIFTMQKLQWMFFFLPSNYPKPLFNSNLAVITLWRIFRELQTFFPWIDSLRTPAAPPPVHAGGDSAAGQLPHVNYPCFSFRRCCCRSLCFLDPDVFFRLSGCCNIQRELSTSMDLRSKGEEVCFGVWRVNLIVFFLSFWDQAVVWIL